MGKKRTKIRDIDHLKQILEDSPLPIDGAYLFGSRASGDYLEQSNRDIILVSSESANIPFPDPATILLNKVPLRGVDLLCHTKEEPVEKAAEISIVAEAIKGKN